MQQKQEDAYRLANRGQLDGVRILKPSSVKLMTSNLLAEGVQVTLRNVRMGNYGETSRAEPVWRVGFGGRLRQSPARRISRLSAAPTLR